MAPWPPLKRATDESVCVESRVTQIMAPPAYITSDLQRVMGPPGQAPNAAVRARTGERIMLGEPIAQHTIRRMDLTTGFEVPVRPSRYATV